MDAKLVEIIEVLSPARFLVRENSTSCIQEEEGTSEDIKTFIDRSTEGSNYIPEKESVCCICINGKYHRVVIEDTNGYSAKCQFLDSKFQTAIFPLTSLKRLNPDLIGRRRLVKEVRLIGVAPHSLLVMHDLNLKFGPSVRYDESAYIFVSNLVKEADNWLCLYKSGSYEKSSPCEANLYYCIPKKDSREGARLSSSSASKDTERAVFTSEGEVPGGSFRGSVIRASAIRHWTEELDKRTWLSLNRTLVLEKFAIFDDAHADDFILYLSKTSSSSTLGQENPPLPPPSHPPPSLSSPQSPSRPKGRGRGAVMERLISSLGLERTNPRQTPPQQQAPSRGYRSTEATPKIPDESRSQDFQARFQSLRGRESSRSSSRNPEVATKEVESSKEPAVARPERGGEEEAVRFEPHHSRSGSNAIAIRGDSRSSGRRDRPPMQEAKEERTKGTRHSLYNPMSQMVFQKKESTGNNLFMPGHISKASPVEEVWLDTYRTVTPIVELRLTNFLKLIKNDKNLSTLASPTALQSHAWASVLSLVDFVGIGPSFPSSSSSGISPNLVLGAGATDSYVAPILWQLNNVNCYQLLPPGCNTPIVIILCPSSKSTMEVYETIQTLLSHQEDLDNHTISLTVTYLYGKRDRKKQMSIARRGSQILVCTPNCLLRMYDSGLTSFDKLCHLICEEADVLLELFQAQMERIMDGFRLAAVNRRYGGTPHQTLVFSKHWTPELDRFVIANLTDPTVTMTSIMEAFYSGNVKTEANWCPNFSKFEVLLEILYKRFSRGEKKERVVLLCTTDKEAMAAYQQLMNAVDEQWKLLLACNLMEEKEIESAIDSVACKEEEEEDEAIILVTSDEMLGRLSKLSNASCVVHRDVPSKQHILASRLWFMRDRYQKTSQRAKRRPITINSTPSTHFLLCGKDAENPTLVSNLSIFFRRAGVVDLPKEIFGSGSRANNAASLCGNFKSFGFCTNQLQCKSRHFFSQKLDMDDCQDKVGADIPYLSVVKIKVTNVETPFTYKAQLLEWTSEGKTTRNEIPKSIALLLAREFSQPREKPLGEKDTEQGVEVSQDELYAWMAGDDITYRVKVLQKNEQDKTARVCLIDHGDRVDVKVEELSELPRCLKEFPPQAVEICVCRLKTVDRDPQWNEQDYWFVRSSILSATLTGRVVFRIGGTLWLDPLEECEKLRHLKVWTTKLDVRRAMLDKGVADENPEHIRLLVKGANDLKDLPHSFKYTSAGTYGYSCHGLFLTTRIEELTDEYTPVLLTAAKNPGEFYVRKAASENSLDRLESDIETSVQLGEIRWSGTPLLEKDVLILAKDHDKRWKRAKVSYVAPEDDLQSKMRVFFLDWGYDREAERSHVLPMPVRFKDALPFQAIRCFMAGLEPCKPRKEDQPSEEEEDEEALIDLKQTESSLKQVESALKPTESESKQRQLKVMKAHGSSVDPWTDSDDDDDDDDDGQAKIENPTEILHPVEVDPAGKGKCSEVFSSSTSPLAKNGGDGEGATGGDGAIGGDGLVGDDDDDDTHDYDNWGERSGDLMLKLNGSCHGTNIITAMMIKSEAVRGEPGNKKYAVRLYDYSPGEHVGDVAQKLVVENEARLTDRALKDLFDAVDIRGKTGAGNVAVKLCKKFIRAEDFESSRDVALDILALVEESAARNSCKGLVHMLSIALKFSRCNLDVEPIMKALGILFNFKALPFYDHCCEARSSGLWQNICSHLYRVTETCLLEECENARLIVGQFLALFACSTCAKDFIEVGGIKALCFFTLNDDATHEEREACLANLAYLTCVMMDSNPPSPLQSPEPLEFGDAGCLHNDSEEGSADYRDGNDGSVGEKRGSEGGDIGSEDEKKDAGGENENRAIVPRNATLPPIILEDFCEEEDEKINDLIPFFKSIFQGQDALPEVPVPSPCPSFYVEKEQEEEEDDEDEEEGENDEVHREENTDGWVPRSGDLEKIFLQLHRDLNSGRGMPLRNPKRHAKSDILEGMEVVALGTGKCTIHNVRLAAIYYLKAVLVRVEEESLMCIRRLYTAGALDNLVWILKDPKADNKLVRETMDVLCTIAKSNGYMRDHIKSLGVYDVVIDIKNQSVDDNIIQVGDALLQALTRNKSGASGKCESSCEMKTEEKLCNFSLTKSTPVIYWLDCGPAWIRLRVAAKDVIPKSLNIIYGDDHIEFSANSNMNEYRFRLRLLHSIDATRCTAVAHASEVIIRLAKAEQSLIWEKLTLDKSFLVRVDTDLLEKQMMEDDDDDDPFKDLPVLAKSTYEDVDDYGDDEDNDTSEEENFLED